ncbi:MAG: GNAT family N-acetyltransferase [Candidatus Hodarchaeota archaeon]
MIEIRAIELQDGEWITEIAREFWISDAVVSRGRVHRVRELPGFIALHNGKKTGFSTFRIDDNECEIVSLVSLVEGIGIGSSLIDAMKRKARSENCRRIWVITTNDNLNAIEYYKKRGFTLVAVHVDAIQEARQLKPEIPQIGEHSIPIRDEIEFELLL